MAKSIKQTPVEIIDMPASDERYIYNVGVDNRGASAGRIPSDVPSAKKRVKRKHATSNIVGALFCVAVMCLLYTSNVIAVNHLNKEVNDLQVRYTTMLSTNEVLKAEINRKASLDRISLLAKEKAGLTNPKEAPVWFEVDREKERTLVQKEAERQFHLP